LASSRQLRRQRDTETTPHRFARIKIQRRAASVPARSFAAPDDRRVREAQRSSANSSSSRASSTVPSYARELGDDRIPPTKRMATRERCSSPRHLQCFLEHTGALKDAARRKPAAELHQQRCPAPPRFDPLAVAEETHRRVIMAATKRSSDLRQSTELASVTDFRCRE